jgi:hypothetical protein
MREIDIHGNLSRVAKNIVVNIDIENLTKNQLKRVVKQVENGYATNGEATTSYMTRSILREYNIPHFIVGNETNSHITWQNIPSDHKMFDELAGLVAITKLSPPENEHYKHSWDKDIKRLERIINERPTTGNASLYYTDSMIRDKVMSASRMPLDKDHKVKELLKKLPDMTEFSIILERKEYEYPLPYEATEKDEDEYYA